MKQSQIDAIFFDVGNVLVDVDPVRSLKAVAKRSALLGHVHPQVLSAGLLAAYLGAKDFFALSDSFNFGSVQTPEFISRSLEILRPIGYRGDVEEFTADFNAMIGEVIEPNYEVLDRLLLTPNHPTVAIISDTNPIHADYIRNDPNLGKAHKSLILEHQFLSHQMGGQKSDSPFIYQNVLKSTLVEFDPRNCLMIDDRRVCLRHARQAGLQTLHLPRGANLATGLRSFGVEV
jgi:FMN phosphatase YigB (HAD superfamily)